VNLGAHLLMDGFLGRYEAAIVVTGDSDLVTPIRMVREHLQRPVGVLNPQRLSGPECRPVRRSAGLQQAASFYRNGREEEGSFFCFIPDPIDDPS